MIRYDGHYIRVSGQFAKLPKPEPEPLPPEPLPGFALDEFNYIQTVYQSLEPDDRVVFLMRHSERPSDTSSAAELTDAGKEYALAVGESMQGGIAQVNDVIYGSTSTMRTRQTAQYFAMGRGDTDYTTLDSIDLTHKDNIAGSLFTNSVTSWPLVSKYSINYDSLSESDKAKFNDKDTVALQLISDLYDALGTKKMGVFVSHDFLMVPIAGWVSQSQVDLEFNDSGKQNWIAYMAGVAIVWRAEHTYVTPIYSIVRPEGTNGYKGIMHGYGNIMDS